MKPSIPYYYLDQERKIQLSNSELMIFYVDNVESKSLIPYR